MAMRSMFAMLYERLFHWFYWDTRRVDGSKYTSVFGDYIDVYDMSQAVEDGATVKIFYESRVIPLSYGRI